MMMMIQVSDDDAGESIVEIGRRGDEGEIGVSTVVHVAHVHSTIEHDSLPIDAHHYAALPNLLTSTCKFTSPQLVTVSQ